MRLEYLLFRVLFTKLAHAVASFSFKLIKVLTGSVDPFRPVAQLVRALH